VAVVGVNHVSIHARDLEASACFYEDLFGMERIPNPDFGAPTVWLRMGGQQLHLFVRGEADPPFVQHFAVTVDDFAEVYRRVMAMGIQDPEPFGHHVYRLPDNAVQLYLRDPAGNLVEVDHPDAGTLEPGLLEDLRPLRRPQTGVHATATLFPPPR
jgi:catechol 2,3-dioxygenase-like lactoylglutathione lyase family enzyme